MTPFGPDQPGVDRLMQHGIPSQYDADHGDLLDLIANDPRNETEYDEFLDAVEAVAYASPSRTVSINDVRKVLVNQWGLIIEPRRYSSFWRRARLDGHLERTGEWEPNTDTKGRNSGKPQPVYRWVGA